MDGIAPTEIQQFIYYVKMHIDLAAGIDICRETTGHHSQGPSCWFGRRAAIS